MNRRKFLLGFTGAGVIATARVSAAAEAVHRLTGCETMNANWFGAKGDGKTDDGEALTRLREAMRADPSRHHRVVFPPGHYKYSNNRWLFGVNKATIEAFGAQFENISDSHWHADKRPLNTHSIWDEVGDVPESAPKTYTVGSRIGDAAIGDTRVTLLEGDKFTSGERVLLHGFNQQDGGFPPNLRYFQWNRIAAANGNVLTLEDPLRHAFRSDDWPDAHLDNFFTVGKARILKLDRSGFFYPRHVEIIGAEFLPAQNGGPDNMVIAAETLIMRNVKATGIATPSENKTALYEDCIFRSAEPDKICDAVTFSRCRFNGNISEASGVNSLTIEDCEITEGIVRVAPRQGFLRRNRILAPRGLEYGVIQNKEAWGTETLVIEDNRIAHDGALRHVVNTGVDGSLTVGAVGPNNEIVLRNTGTVDPVRSILPGTLLFAADLSDWGRVTEISHDGAHWAIAGDWKKAPRGTWKFNAIQHIRERGTLQSGGIRQIFRDSRAPQLLESGEGGVVRIMLANGFRFSEGYERRQILGYVREISARVIRPYTGPDPSAALWIELNDGSRNTTYIGLDLSRGGYAQTRIGGTASNDKPIRLVELPPDQATLQTTIYFRSGNKGLRGSDLQLPELSVEFVVEAI